MGWVSDLLQSVPLSPILRERIGLIEERVALTEARLTDCQARRAELERLSADHQREVADLREKVQAHEQEDRRLRAVVDELQQGLDQRDQANAELRHQVSHGDPSLSEEDIKALQVIGASPLIKTQDLPTLASLPAPLARLAVARLGAFGLVKRTTASYLDILEATPAGLAELHRRDLLG
jgi:septal ring factor EnvC (AmiA/AmiB activator)